MSNTAEDFENKLTFDICQSNDNRIVYIAKRMREILTVGLGLTLNESTEDTPERVARMWVNELFAGLNPQNAPEISLFDNPNKGNAQPILVKVDFTSVCEHHLLPFRGEAYISYIPQTYVVGLSKIPRLVNFYAAKPQMQERLTSEIAQALSDKLETEDIAVAIKASHDCMVCRGVQAKNSYACTSVLLGKFNLDKDTKREFYRMIKD